MDLPGSPGVPLARRRKARFPDLTLRLANGMTSSPPSVLFASTSGKPWAVVGWFPGQALPLVHRPCECHLLTSPSKSSITTCSFGVQLLPMLAGAEIHGLFSTAPFLSCMSRMQNPQNRFSFDDFHYFFFFLMTSLTFERA